MKKRKLIRNIAVILMAIVLCVAGLATVGVLANEFSSPKLIYKLDFSDPQNRGQNSAPTDIPAAHFKGTGYTYTENAIKGNTSVMLSDGSARTNYIAIDGEVLNNESITVAGWFKIPGDVAAWARLFEIYGDDDNFISVMPYAPNYFNGLHICAKIDGIVLRGSNDADNIIFEGSDPTAKINVPEAGYVLPVYDAWVHYAYEFTPDALNIYQNGKLLVSKKGDFTASQFYSEDAKIALGATLVTSLNDGDIKASFADIRVYKGALTEKQIASEYQFNYKDFLTTGYDFENGLVESVRGYNGSFSGSASIGNVEGRGNVLVLDGKVTGSNVAENRSAMQIPSKTMHGHNSVTVEMDLYIDKDCGMWTRIFEFSVHPEASWIFAAKWGNPNTSVLSCTTGVEQIVSCGAYFDEWVHFAVTIEGTTAKVFINGELVGISENFRYKNGMFWEGKGKHSFGKSTYYGDKPLDGMMDNIQIYQTALTEKEIMIEAGVLKEPDDKKAVRSAYDQLSVDWDGQSFEIDLPSYMDDGVKVTWKSSNEDIITNGGYVTKPAKDTEITLTAVLSRGDVTMEKKIKLKVKAVVIRDPSIVFESLLHAVRFEGGSYYEGLMKTNLDFMMELDKERILANYRKWAGLDTNGVRGYENAGGEGQFESHYMLALAKASLTMPDYTYNGETPLERLRYMIIELKKCQDAYALLCPEEAGYVGAIPTDWFHAIEEGRWTDKYGNQVIVPWYIGHKTIQMLLDVSQCVEDEEISSLAYEMMLDWCDWATYMTKGRDETTRYKILGVEYGGLPEEFYEIYSITKDPQHIKLARFFEEEKFFARIYNNEDILINCHANTWVVKFLGCCAAYEATDNEYYKQIAINGFEMIMDRVYSMGGTGLYEHWHQAGVLKADKESCETCCTYNLLKYADYLYRWTGDKRYADYYDRAYTNHILASMAPDSGLKTYLVNTEFGLYKIYLSKNNCFECCCSTGQESFVKLTQGIYYTAENKVIVNMFYPSEITTPDGIRLTQSGNFFTDQKTLLTVGSAGEFTVSIRIPDYADPATVGIKINGETYQFIAENGYINITDKFNVGDTIEYSVPFTFRWELLAGNENSYALMYGPMLLVADLGDENVHDVQDFHKNWGTAYTGSITDKLVLAGDLNDCTKVSFDEAGNITVIVSTKNQGDLTFVPFNQIFHSRYGMYFELYDTIEEADKVANEGYSVEGNEYQNNFDDEEDLKGLDQYVSESGQMTVEDGKLVVPAPGEHKLMLGLNIKAPYTVDASIFPLTVNGSLNNGIYLYATGVKNGLDQIKAYNVHIEKAAGADVYTIQVHRFNNGYLGSVGSVKLHYPEDGVIDLHVYAGESEIIIYVEGSKNPVLKVSVDKAFLGNTKGDVGVRAYTVGANVDSLKVISAEITTVGVESLENIVAEADQINTDKYTDESVNTFRTALDKAKSVLADANKTQAAVNEAESALRTAMDALSVKTPAPEPPITQEPPTTENPSAAEKPDPLGIVLIVVAVIVVGCIAVTFVFVFKKKKSTK